MSEEKEIKETEGPSKESKPSRRRRFNYRWIVRNVPYFLFLALLAVIYIYNGHNADKTIRNINKVEKELKELQFQYKTLQGEVMFKSKQSELANVVGAFGLKELVQPPVILKEDDKK